MRRLVLLVLALALLAGGCGEQDLRARGEALRERAREARERAEARADELVERVRAALEDLERSVPEATRDTQAPSSRGNRLETYMTSVLESVDDYWTRTLRASGIDEPRVTFLWIPPGRVSRSGCGEPADDLSAFYCPTDDTIYVGEELAADILRGVGGRFPGERAGQGRAVGDFGLAYVIAHEYAHNVQNELGLMRTDPRYGVAPLELQADCMAGLWGNAVYRAGRYDDRDVEEAISTAQAAGDFDYGNAQHHGTPDERRAAWLAGFESGQPAVCRQFVPGT